MKRLFAAIAFLALTASAASALDLTQKFRDADQGFIVNTMLPSQSSANCEGKVGGPCLTLGGAIYQALLAGYPDEQTISGDEKFTRGKLAQKVREAKEANFTLEELTLIKKLVGKLYTPVIVTQAYQMIDPGQK